MNVRLGTAIILTGLAWETAPALAEPRACMDLVREFALQQNVSLDEMTGSGSSATTPSAPGGMVLVPQSNAPMIVKPLPRGNTRMQTAPPAAPDEEAGSTTGGNTGPGTSMDNAARHAQIESLILAARKAAAGGDETGCLDHLVQARDLVNGAPQPDDPKTEIH